MGRQKTEEETHVVSLFDIGLRSGDLLAEGDVLALVERDRMILLIVTDGRSENQR